MAQLVISLANQIVKRVTLTQGTYLIGRHPQCDIILVERTVSQQHARLVYAEEDCFLEDLGSTNGILVNKDPIKKYLLVDNDVISIGKYQLVFRSALGVLTQLRQLSLHPRLVDDERYADQATLEIVDGTKQGHFIPLQRQPFTLGGNGTGIPTITIEKNLAGDFLLHTLNERQVKTVSKLQDGEIFEVGSIQLRFHQARKMATL